MCDLLAVSSPQSPVPTAQGGCSSDKTKSLRDDPTAEGAGDLGEGRDYPDRPPRRPRPRTHCVSDALASMNGLVSPQPLDVASGERTPYNTVGATSHTRTNCRLQRYA